MQRNNVCCCPINRKKNAFDSHMNESQITNDPNLTYDLFNTCPLCELENASIDPNCSNIEQHPIIQEFVQKLVKKIRKDVIKLRKEIELAEQTIEQIKNDTIDVNTKTNNWLNDSYNLLFHNGKIRRTQSEYSISSQSRENSFQNETIASLSSQNTDSSIRKGEYTLNTDSLCNSPEQRNPNRKYLISELGVHILHCGNQANI